MIEHLPRFPSLHNKHCTLGVCGGIAAYKTAELVRLLTKQHLHVQVVMTPSAQQFITPLTFQALSGNPVLTNPWPEPEDPQAMPHIRLSRQADCLLVAPCTANSMARYAHGLGETLLDNLVLARNCPVALAPAMNVEMWNNPATQRNLTQLQQDGVHIFGPASGLQACGETGLGRMLEPWQLVYELARLLTPATLKGQHVVVTAGPTYEAIDPVRGITNRSSGQMGYAMAQAAWLLGASNVTLISGPCHLPIPHGVEHVPVQSAKQMHQAVMQQLERTHLFLGVAAVADYGIANPSMHKQKKQANATTGLQMEFVINPDILAEVGQKALQRNDLRVVGFAAETHDLHTHAQDKLTRKNAHLIVGNLAQHTLGSDCIQPVLFAPHQTALELAAMPKLEAALTILQHVSTLP